MSLDPSYTQNPADPLQVTYAVSASATTQTNGATQTVSSLPTGVLELFSDGSLADTLNVGGTVVGGNITVTYSAYGQHITDVVFDSGTTSTTTGDESETIEPLPLTQSFAWGTDQGTMPTIAATLIGETADVTITDANFHGATNLQLTDSTGAACSAPVSGTTASCVITDLSTPSAYTVSYPGGTTTTTTQTVAPNGVQQVTTNWPAETVTVAHPAVTVQQATVTECGQTTAWYDVCANQPDPWPNPLGATVGQRIQLWASAQGDAASDPVGAGYLDWTVAGGVEGSDFQEMNLVQGSTDCSQTFQTFSLSGGGVSPDEAEGGCGLTFETPGTYTVSLGYVSDDPNYGSSSGPLLTIDVSS